MASSVKGLAPLATPAAGVGRRVAIVRTRWNAPVVDALVAGAREELARSGVREEDIVELQVPGAYELPFAASSAASRRKRVPGGYRPEYDAIICIGCLIKGETMHFEYICEAVTTGIMRVQLDSGVPVIFGVLCVLTEEQALVRAGVRPGMHNHGVEWAQAALQMAGYGHCPAIASEAKLAKW